MKVKKYTKQVLIILCSSIALIFLYFILFPWSIEPGLKTQASLFVNGKQVGEEGAIWIYQHGKKYYSDVPLTAVIDALGFQVFWQENDTAQIEIENNTFILDDHNIYDCAGKTISLAEGLFASTLEMDGPPKEIFIEVETLNTILPELGVYNVNIQIDVKKREVLIIQKWD